MRRTGTLDHYLTTPQAWLKQELDRHGDLHPLLQERFLDGDPQRLQKAKKMIDAEYNSWATQMRWR
ncbi:hypothetical protein [Streptomyces sp. A012304]|uniref:hypothetical protein n=1 Tax=Streptomyces sp. A012304 TaxID=375446 RepID=UPI00222FD4AB|nr:hypothetical protein [Streptomyces sp. A012304]GKQ40278.1 hypothetical protein ALMP_68040 [Streptomyces sp. A012304]